MTIGDTLGLGKFSAFSNLQSALNAGILNTLNSHSFNLSSGNVPLISTTLDNRLNRFLSSSIDRSLRTGSAVDLPAADTVHAATVFDVPLKFTLTVDGVGSITLNEGKVTLNQTLSALINNLIHDTTSNSLDSSLDSWIQFGDGLLKGEIKDSNGTVIGNIVNNQTINLDSKINDIGIIGSHNIVNTALSNTIAGIVGNANTLSGQAGNDVLVVVGTNNSVSGGAGNDFLKANGGSNTLKGGTGQDVFGLPDILDSSLNNLQGQSVIQDFEKGTDQLGLPTITTFDGTSSHSRVVNFNELSLTQQGQNTVISYQGTTLAVVNEAQATQFSAADFVNPSDLNLSIL